ncbi:hypothetical protein IRJ41_016640, partial [Triplophysa rosa]
QTLEVFDKLFYAPVCIDDKFQMMGMLDSGSMACTFNALPMPTPLPQEIMLIGCGGKATKPKCMYEVELKVYGERCLVHVLVVLGQRDDLIIGTNVIKFLMHRMKISDDYWRILSNSVSEPCSPCEQFLDVMANTCRWRGGDPPDRVGTVKLQRSVTLMARQEHLVWGRLPSNAVMSLGSTVIVEATSSRSMPRDILIGRVVTPLWGDWWVPLKVTNLSDKPVTLKRNRKLADVFPGLAVEDFDLLQGFSHASSVADLKQRLNAVGLDDINIDSCSVKDTVKEKLVQLLENYNDVFSKHALDCGEARGFVHRIRLIDERLFRLPYRRIPPAHYQKLRQVLSEMKEQGIIRKSVSEYASPLVLVWKKDGGLRIYLNFSSLLCYLDDLLVFAPEENVALERLEVVFQRLRDRNLKLSPKKYHLMRASIKFLDHIIDGNGVSVDPSKVEAIARLSKSDLMEEDGCTPSVRRIKSVLGMILYYQHFIPNCSSMAKPLFSLTAGQKRRAKVKTEARAGTYRKLKPTDWTSKCDDALYSLKESLLHCVVLAHPDFSLPLILSIDASLDGLGAVLSQIPGGEEKARPVAFTSKSLSNSQKRNPAHKLKFLALKWGVCEKFSHWLKGHTFTIWTDNNPLTYILTKAKLDVCEQRWVYVKTLMSYLHEAAQKTECFLQIRGKKKLADKWDPTVYTVEDRNLQTNIYKLIDEGGKSKTEGQEFAEDFLESDHSVCSRSDSNQNPSENEAVGGSDQVSDIEIEASSGNSDPQIGTVNDSHANRMPDTQSQIPTDTQGVRTRAGRIVKRVSRLIESMAQRPFYAQRVGSSVSRRSGSFLSLF